MHTVKLNNGGQLERVEMNGKNKLQQISFGVNGDGKDRRTINMYLNEDSLTYLSIEEALNLRDALNDVIKDAVNIK